MGRRGHDRGAVAGRSVDHQGPGFQQGLPDLGDGIAHPRVGFELGAQKLGHHLVG